MVRKQKKNAKLEKKTSKSNKCKKRCNGMLKRNDDYEF